MAPSLGTSHKPIVDTVLDRLELDAAAIAREMTAATRAEVDQYGAVRDPGFASEVLAHAAEHVEAFVRAGRARRPPHGAELEFVRERGARRARELLPLDALLEAYLVGQRTVWEAIVAAAGDSPEGMLAAQELTGLTFEYTHAINVAVADAYLRESNALASEVERARRDLLDRLLSGGDPRPEDDRRAEALGLRPSGDHVVVVALLGGADADGRRLVGALEREGSDRPFVVARHNEAIALMPVYVRRGPRELRAALERTSGLLTRRHGVELRAGVSAVCVGLRGVGRGYHQAVHALRHAGAGTPVVAFEEIGLLDFLAEGADEAARALIPAGARALVAADERHGVLSATLQAYADCDLNVARTAERLVVHPNTVHYRLRRVRDVSGRDPRRLAELVELTTALRLLKRA